MGSDWRAGAFTSWAEIIDRDIRDHIGNITGEAAPDIIAQLQHIKRRYEPYFGRIEPVCFLDDLTIKNVIVSDGTLQGIVDFDWVCYGDPLYMIALTQTAVVSDIGDRGMAYVEALCRQWGVDREQRALIDFTPSFMRWHLSATIRGSKTRSANSAWFHSL